MSAEHKEALIRAFHSSLLEGENYDRINQARKQAEAILGQSIFPGSPLTKVVDEAMEAAVVRVAPLLIQQCTTTHQAYDRLVELLNRQPTLGVRSSTSVLQQAYSTPIPIAYLASTLAGITPETTVYEPTAGNGALLIGVSSARAIANELNPDRFTELQHRGYAQLTQQDATNYRPKEQVDVLICNPPFGPVQDGNGKIRRFELPGNRRGTRQVDHAIAFKALEAIKDQGRAVLILGGKLGDDEDLRSNRYNSIESRGFFFALYQHYNVTQHFSIWGNLYRKQGAGFPIDIILIEGRGQSQRDLPAADVPIIYKSFDVLKERLPDELIQHRGLQPLSSDLEASRNGRSIFVSGQAPDRDSGIDVARLSALDDAQNSVDARSLVGGEWRESDPNASTTQPSSQSVIDARTSDAVRRRSDEGTRADLVVDAGMGRNLRRSQRHLSNQVSTDQWTDVPHIDRDRSSRDPRGVDAGTQRNHAGELAIPVDLRNVRVTSQPTQETQIMANPEVEHPVTPDAPLNVAYLPRSQGKSPGTLIPSNMATAAQTALDKLERAVGDVDEYVRQRMGYDSKEKLWEYLYAEQIDANALAFWQRDRDKVFLNGDQTGNGKGRFCASQIVDAINQGYIPVFITQKSTLYVSMLADLQDIGKSGVNIFATDNNLRLALPNGSQLRTSNPAQQEAEMQRIMRQGIGVYNAIFTTYSQLQTIDSGKEPFRRDFLRQIAPNAIFIFDEAHEAGGSTGEKGWTSNSAAPNRAEFARELIDLSVGAVFASATAIKDPAVMDLYARRSDAAEAVASIESLQRTLKAGGVPLQQMMATKFVASGQMLRRERSFENVAFQAKVVPVDRDVADNISAIMRAISQFDLVKEKAVAKLSKELKKEAKAASEDSSIGQAGARSTNFTSLMNNAIDQGLLCQKAEAAVQEAIAAIGCGQKPVIAVANTMDAFIGQYAEDSGLEPGDAINISFGDVLSRYLERSRDVTIKDHEGNMTRRRMTDEELTDAALAAYDTAREIIDTTDLSTIPLSSIDYIKWRLTQAGFRVDEITGRHNIIDYTPTGEQGYAHRSANETKPQARVEIVDQFNAGSIDVLILNRAGATGINLHSSEKFADQRQRHLIMAQAERDINQVMQMLGRVNRFGQVSEPEITLLMSDIPAEKRLGALLSHKMATLNANTTADRDSALSIANVVDFLTPYGEEVIHEILDDNPELEAKLAYPRNNLQGDSDIEAISRITGRIPLLSVKEQEDLYALIESETLDLVAQKQAMGESVLEAQQLDLDARTIGRMEVIPDEGQVRNEFTGSVYLDVVDAKIPVKPFNQLEVINLVREHLGLEAVQRVADHNFDQVEQSAKDDVKLTIAKLRQATRDYRTELLPSKLDSYSRNKLTERLNTQFNHIRDVLRQFPSGQTVRVVSPEGNVTYGVVARTWQKGHNGSPTAPSNWKAQILTDNQARMLTIPLTRFNRGKTDSLITISAQDKNWDGHDIYEAFDLRQAADRTERQIFQGNLLKAYEKYPTGKFLNYTDYQGNVRQGLVMPASFDIQESLREQPVSFSEPHQVKAFMTELTAYQGSVKTLDEVLTIKSQASARFGSTAAGFVLQTPKSAIGDRFSLDQSLIAAAGNEFYSISDRMELIVPAENIDRVLTILMKEQEQTLAAFDFKDKAREFLGVRLPELEVVSDQSLVEKSVPQAPLIGAASEIFEQVEVPRQQAINNTTNQPTGSAERNVTTFLHEAGLWTAVVNAEDYHLRIEHAPYIPLVIERHGNQLYLTHYLEQNGDTFIRPPARIKLDEQAHSSASLRSS
ncbi:strawberry notch C-terminal domain-containing protein [Leptolyngbya sp. AN03gr2]|uniref:strawberry notch C-terminal domain-containing protein n=1 Tax=unclassified Leptolyngbya TaxID=2650499 RepID=UPI003D3186F3